MKRADYVVVTGGAYCGLMAMIVDIHRNVDFEICVFPDAVSLKTRSQIRLATPDEIEKWLCGK